MATQFHINAGPSKFDLMLSLFERKQVTFTIEDTPTLNATIEAVIQQIQAEDGNSESWNIEGIVKHKVYDHSTDWEGRIDESRFTGWFDSRARRGTIRIDGIVEHCTECGAEEGRARSLSGVPENLLRMWCKHRQKQQDLSSL